MLYTKPMVVANFGRTILFRITGGILVVILILSGSYIFWYQRTNRRGEKGKGEKKVQELLSVQDFCFWLSIISQCKKFGAFFYLFSFWYLPPQPSETCLEGTKAFLIGCEVSPPTSKFAKHPWKKKSKLIKWPEFLN